jgi:DtxR family transcriptional regulator, Mn-dependent transcriptional regulator
MASDLTDETQMKPARQPLSSSLEDYMEAVLDLVRTGRVARVRDIARRLNVGMPSVSVALKTLSARGLVNYDPYQVVTLTDRGEKVGQDITRRHAVLQGFLTDVLGIDPVLAQSNACRMEHAIDDEVLERLEGFAGFLHRCPSVARSWATAMAQAKL